jgi:hypothetical protein
MNHQSSFGWATETLAPVEQAGQVPLTPQAEYSQQQLSHSLKQVPQVMGL